MARADALLDQSGGDREADHRLADPLRGVGQDRGAGGVQFLAGGARADGDAVAAGFADRLGDELVEIGERVSQPFLLAADMGLDVLDQRLLAQVIFDDPGHIGIDRLVIRNAGADRIGDRDIAGLPRADQPAHAQHGFRAEHVRVEEIVVQAAIDRVDGAQAGDGAHVDALVLDHEVRADDERHAHFARQEDMLEIGGVVDAGREQHDLRIAMLAGGDVGHRGAQAAAVIIDRLEADAGHEVRKGAQHEMPVLDDVGDAGGRAGIILEHAEIAEFVADDVDAADMHIGAVRDREILHLRPVIGVAIDQFGGDDAVFHDMAGAVNVAQEEVEGGDALDAGALQQIPFAGGDDARDTVERQDAVDRGGVRIDREGDAEIDQLGFRRRGAGAQGVEPDAAESLDQPFGHRPGIHALAGQLTEIAARIVIGPGMLKHLVQTSFSVGRFL